jgi:hypothetical protein
MEHLKEVHVAGQPLRVKHAGPAMLPVAAASARTVAMPKATAVHRRAGRVRRSRPAGASPAGRARRADPQASENRTPRWTPGLLFSGYY